MLRVRIGVQQADGDRLHSLPHQRRRDALQLLLLDAAQDLAGGGDPLAQLEPQAALDEGRRLREEQVVELRGTDAAQLQHVAEPGGGDQRGARAPAFQHGVGRDRRAMGDQAHEAAGDAGQAQRAPDPDEGRLLEVGRRGGQLMGPDPAGPIGEHDVGEGPADVGADAHRPFFLTRHDLTRHCHARAVHGQPPGIPPLIPGPTLQDLEFWKGFDGPFYGFEHVELARNHTDEAHVGQHYALWMERKGLANWRDYFRPPTGTNDRQRRTWDIPEAFHYGTWIAERCCDLLTGYAARGERFFLWSSFFDPHPKYLVPEPWDAMYDPFSA